MKEGWICPRCGRVWAPWIPQCKCTVITSTTVTSGHSMPADSPEATCPPAGAPASPLPGRGQVYYAYGRRR